MANHKRRKARRHRSLMYSGTWNGNGVRRFRASEVKARRAADGAIADAG